VADVVKICDRATIPFIARGAGTGLSGGASTSRLCSVTALMRQIIDIDLEKSVVVQPGVLTTGYPAVSGFYYAPDPSSQIICSIGGNVRRTPAASIASSMA